MEEEERGEGRKGQKARRGERVYPHTYLPIKHFMVKASVQGGNTHKWMSRGKLEESEKPGIEPRAQ